MGEMKRIVATALAAAGLPALAAGFEIGIADRVIEAVQSARREAGVAPLDRRADLDGLALARARHVASLPHRERLTAGGAIGEDLRRAGVAYRRASLHLDLNRGYPDPAHGFVRSWSAYGASWESALSADYDAVGIAAARADDGWVVLAAVLLEDEPPRPVPVPADLEALTVEAVNEARRAHGRTALAVNPLLAEVARAHSLDMVRRRYFDHVAPDGIGAPDRLRRHGLEFSRVGENLHRNAGYEDAVATAVRSWLGSHDHRELLLAPEFWETGVGVAVGEGETVYFTQLFLAPPIGPAAGPPE
jgi:uncharacterized protein YkwD